MRATDLFWQAVEFAPLVLGGFIALLNFYLSFVRYPLYRLLGRPFRWVSGVPLVGSALLIVFAVLHLGSPLLLGLCAVLICLDTGSPIWFAGVMLWQFAARRRD